MMKNIKLIKALILFFILIFTSFIIWYKMTAVTVIELGMFAGSNWDVSDSDSYKIIDDAIARFEASHKKVKVHYYSGIPKRDYNEWLCQRLVSGKAPDVFMVREDQIDFLVSSGALKKLDKLITRHNSIKKWEYFTSAWESGLYNDELYALPYEVNFMLMAVNKTLLDAHNLKMPDNTWSWNDFYNLCRSLTLDQDKDGLTDTAGVCNYTWKEAVYSNGASLFDSTGKIPDFSSPKVVEAVRFMQKLSALNRDRVFTQEDFDNGRVAFMPLSFVRYKTYISYPYRITKDINYDWQCVTMPAGNYGNNISEVNTLMMGINSHTKQEKISYELLEELTHNLYVQMNVARSNQGTSPLRILANSEYTKSLLEDSHKNKDDLYMGLPARILNIGYHPRNFSGYRQYMAVAGDSITQMINEKQDADNALKLLQKNITSLMEQ